MAHEAPLLYCKYCLEGVEVRFLHKRNVYICPVCDTHYANNSEMISQLTQAGKKQRRRQREWAVNADSAH